MLTQRQADKMVKTFLRRGIEEMKKENNEGFPQLRDKVLKFYNQSEVKSDIKNLRIEADENRLKVHYTIKIENWKGELHDYEDGMLVDMSQH